MIYVISDTHFGHANIIKYCDRPFVNIEDMNLSMIRYWNSTVKETDTVIHVGDFAFGNPKEYLEQLSGFKVLVKGNHDGSAQKMLDAGFNLVLDSCILKDATGVKFYFTHYPMDPDKARCMILDQIEVDYHVHGHVHNKTPAYYGERSINVSCENTQYRPVLLESLVQLYKDSP